MDRLRGWGITNERPGSGHVIWEPMIGLKKNCIRWRKQTNRQTDIATLWPTRPSGAELVKTEPNGANTQTHKQTNRWTGRLYDWIGPLGPIQYIKLTSIKTYIYIFKLSSSFLFLNWIGLFQSGKDFSLEEINCCLLSLGNIFPKICPISSDCNRTKIVEAN